jgi:hypothetical protein
MVARCNNVFASVKYLFVQSLSANSGTNKRLKEQRMQCVNPQQDHGIANLM